MPEIFRGDRLPPTVFINLREINEQIIEARRLWGGAPIWLFTIKPCVACAGLEVYEDGARCLRCADA